MARKRVKHIEHSHQVYQISTMVAGNFSLQEVLDRLAEAAARVTNANSCSIRLLNDEGSELEMRSTYNLSEQYRNKGPVSKNDAVISEAFSGKAVVLDNMLDDDRIKYKEAAAREGLVSQLTVAMFFKDRPIGILRLYSNKKKAFVEEDAVLARMVASQCAIAITNARLYNQALEGARMSEQMRLAAVLQRRMIPQSAPCMAGLDISAIYQPCFEIGGDLYDFIQLDDHTLIVAMADVIGKGIPAAIMMSMFRGTLRAYSDGGYRRHSMAEVISELNHVAHRECRNGEFITLFIARIDTRRMTMTYCNCGHEPALLMRGSGITELSKGGLVLGVMPDEQHQIETIELRENDSLLLYTDGLIDAVNFDQEFWGKQNLLTLMKENAANSADTAVRNILAYRRRFVGLAPQIDDTSMVWIKLDPDANKDCPNCPNCKKRINGPQNEN